MKTSMLRGVSVTGATAMVKERGRGDGDGAANRGGGSSLAQLESVLQRLSKHEHRSHIESVERTSVQTQQQMLRDRLLQVQEELAKSQGEKATLCEKLGALQQAKDGQQSEIDHLKVELRSSRESQAMMARKVAQMEKDVLDTKRDYIRSVTSRTKTATELLSRLSITGALRDTADVNKAVATSCDVWSGAKPNKRKRVEPLPERVPVVDGVNPDESMEGYIPAPLAEVPIPEAPKRPETPEHREVAVPSSTAQQKNGALAALDVPDSRTPAVDAEDNQKNQECQSCITLTKEYEQHKVDADGQLKHANDAITRMRAEFERLLQAHGEGQAKISTLSLTLGEKESTIEQIKEELDAQRLQVEEMRLATVAQKDEEMKEKDPGEDVSGRVKVLEDNLAQLNTYADHLEMLISQCASCSVKLQSEGTQESSK